MIRQVFGFTFAINWSKLITKKKYSIITFIKKSSLFWCFDVKIGENELLLKNYVKKIEKSFGLVLSAFVVRSHRNASIISNLIEYKHVLNKFNKYLAFPAYSPKKLVGFKFRFLVGHDTGHFENKSRFRLFVQSDGLER